MYMHATITHSFIYSRWENTTSDPIMHQSGTGLKVILIHASLKAPARITMGRPNMSFVIFLDSCRLIMGWYIK